MFLFGDLPLQEEIKEYCKIFAHVKVRKLNN